ncbi:HEAT repeat domain-containing protein [Lyngbya aestuarii]|uniref:HEAT repeat domain-containing protein n=1 Tax=Lyngbya aestuarii TaxID=118322 RepID=UPI00403D8F73
MTDTNLATELIQAVEQADSAPALLKAVETLADSRSEAGIPTLIAALSYNNPGAAVAAVEGLVQLGEAAVLPLLNLIDDYNYGGRAWAIRALAGIGDPRAIETLLEAAETDFAMSVRRAAVKGLGYLHWSKMSAQEVPAAQARVLKSLSATCKDHEWVVRYASVAALQALANSMVLTQPDLFSQITDHLEEVATTEADLTVRSRSQLALEQLQRDKVAKLSSALR